MLPREEDVAARRGIGFSEISLATPNVILGGDGEPHHTGGSGLDGGRAGLTVIRDRSVARAGWGNPRPSMSEFGWCGTPVAVTPDDEPEEEKGPS